ncbi:MAG: WD40/YVTN/BNR-like repeat-containing protein [Actinomycetota bacterium]
MLFLIILAAIGPVQAGSRVGQGGLELDPEVVMLPEAPPVPVSEIVPVPGTGGSIAYAVGHAYGTVASDISFLRWERSSGWKVEGSPISDLTGKPFGPSLAALSAAPNGEAWAAPKFGGFIRRTSSGSWVETSFRTTSPLNGASISSDGLGAFGYAVGARATIYRLDRGAWTAETPGLSSADNAAVPTLMDVAVIDRDRAVAVGYSGNPSRLVVMRRENGTWTLTPTGLPMFDVPPAPTADPSTANRLARGMSVDVQDGTIWIAGFIQPVDPQRLIGGGAERPFVLQIRDEVVTSHCPAQYRASQQDAEAIEICDRRMPFTAGFLVDLDAVPGGVVAGGTGLFSFDGGSWRRLPSPVGFVQRVGFSSLRDGWVTPFEGVTPIRDLQATDRLVGRYTDDPPRPVLERWPSVVTEPLTAVDMDTDGVGIAVGENGTLVRLDPLIGVTSLPTPTREHLRDVDLYGAEGYAVGAGGTVLRIDPAGIVVDHRASSMTDRGLLALHLMDPRNGFAVGEAGTILRLDRGIWRVDSSGTEATLRAVSVTADGMPVAAGSQGTLLERRGGRWQQVQDLGPVAEENSFQALALAPDGRLVAAGTGGLMLVRDADGDWSHRGLAALSATVTSLVPSGDQVIAVTGVGETYARGGRLAQAWGGLMAGGPDGWMDVRHDYRRSVSAVFDAPAPADPIHDAVLDARGSGWAVGGFPASADNGEGHRRGPPSMSVWRVDLSGDPEPSPMHRTVELPRLGGTSFGFVSDSACTGISCGPTLGIDTRADVVLTQALREMDLAAQNGDIEVVVHGGNQRRIGIPDELAPVRDLFSSLSVPVYGALGPLDLRPGLASSGPLTESDLTASNSFFREVYAKAPAPWGTGPLPEGVRRVSVPGAAQPEPGARTHYAFDIGEPGSTVRVAVLDTSQNLALDVTSQNPPERQDAWLGSVLAISGAQGVPVVVVAHDPIVLPHSSRADAGTITPILQAGARAFVAGGIDARNLVGWVGGAGAGGIPMVAAGTGGSPLRERYRPQHGAYHAWLRVTVMGGATKLQAIPILRDLAIDLAAGRVLRTGQASDVLGLGRLPDVGGVNALQSPDTDQANALHVRFPFKRPCGLLETPGVDERCRPSDVLVPDHRFVSSDRTIADFVERDPADPGSPLRLEGSLVPSTTSGLLCAFRPGRVTVALETGTHRAELPVEVIGGAGPCSPEGVRVLPSVLAPDPPQLRTGELQGEDTRPPIKHGRVPETAVVAAVAPPPINPAPAPPGGGTGSKQEEHEAASERANFTARRSESSSVGPMAFVLALAVLAWTGGAVMARRRRLHAGPVMSIPRPLTTETRR